ncbi:MAG: oxygen-independent coproporphyrinogen III oxidase [Deltaproteobacteria bacterium HGW-Deltaproteobacteria-14]|jgi:oxygen-independent coproporphyrinogen-3 oxidase|nr:MAG: oxygen-independent coproporphyrinogen III oxidase [Deltaproteobacteria bacterium HGW-Deltaproteobacteria-14]
MNAPSLQSTAPPDVTPDIVRTYDRPGPRYTSYPTADRFTTDFGPGDYVAALARANSEHPGEPVSLYFHLPFCEALCTYCGCNVVVSKSETTRRRYLDRLAAEVAMVAAHLPDRRLVSQLHLGGGTPNSYSDAELTELMEIVRSHFDVPADAEVAIEVDPRHADSARLAHLREIGFNRLSMGVQDFAPKVQTAIRRVTSFGHVRDLVETAREVGFVSVNLDLIYGLPFQTGPDFGRTVQKVIALRPDRVALYSFAWVPWVKPHQKVMDATTFPDSDTKIGLFCDARRTFLDAGYDAIGMDHFALPDDELAIAQREGRLRRNFQGYTAMKVNDVVGFGMSAIGDIGGAYVANTRQLHSYNKAIDAGALAVDRGVARDVDDEARRWLIHELMCNFHVDDAQLQSRFGLSLAVDFESELAELRASEDLAPLIEVGSEQVDVTPLGRLFVRNVATVFDARLRRSKHDGPLYSRMV